MSEKYPLLERCSGDTEDFGTCQQPANFTLYPYVGAPEKAPFCHECAEVLTMNFPEANNLLTMTIRQAHLWIAQGRDCICPHPGTNCEMPAAVVVKYFQGNDAEVYAICPDCIACSNGPVEGFQEVFNAFYLEPTTKK